MVIPWLFQVDLVCAAPCMAGANQAQTKRKPSANQSANQIPHDVPSFAGRYLRRRKPSRKPNRLSAAIETRPYLPLFHGLRPRVGGLSAVGFFISPYSVVVESAIK